VRVGAAASYVIGYSGMEKKKIIGFVNRNKKKEMGRRRKEKLEIENVRMGAEK
jgi:hypothetical protein